MIKLFQTTNASDSTPESESYEIVNKSDRESSGDETSQPVEVETVTSTTSKGGDDTETDKSEGKICHFFISFFVCR